MKLKLKTATFVKFMWRSSAKHVYSMQPSIAPPIIFCKQINSFSSSICTFGIPLTTNTKALLEFKSCWLDFCLTDRIVETHGASEMSKTSTVHLIPWYKCVKGCNHQLLDPGVQLERIGGIHISNPNPHFTQECSKRFGL